MFLAKLEALARQGVGVFNPPPIVRWNLTKTYLRELASAGVPTIPTVWHERVDAAQARAAMDALECDRLVVKQQIGAGAIGQELLVRGEIADDWRFDRPAMLQPFLPAIADQGELSFVFVDKAFSHAVRKLPARGDYRIQSLYGGREEAWPSRRRRNRRRRSRASRLAVRSAALYPCRHGARAGRHADDNGSRTDRTLPLSRTGTADRRIAGPRGRREAFSMMVSPR